MIHGNDHKIKAAAREAAAFILPLHIGYNCNRQYIIKYLI